MNFINNPRKRRMRYHWLAEKINEHGFSIGVELGAATGVTTKYLLDNCPGLTLLAIDSWSEGHRAQWKTPTNANTYENFVLKFAKPKYINLLVDKSISWEAATQYADESFDFIFIDASHDYASVIKDIKNWSPKIRKGGLICGHDIHYEDVHKAVYKFFPDYRVVREDNVWYHFKSK